MRLYLITILVVLTALITACGSGGDGSDGDTNPPQQQTDTAFLRDYLRNNNMDGDPADGRTIPSIADPLPQLGMKLFFSKALSGDKDVACATCHHPFFGGADGLSLSVGTEAVDPDFLGPGREHSPTGFEYDGGPNVPRHATSVFNIVLYDKILFMDGRIEVIGDFSNPNGDGELIDTPDTLPNEADVKAFNLVQAQALFPVLSQEEMRSDFMAGTSDSDTVRQGLVDRLVNQEIPNTWLTEFQATFNSTEDAQTLITYENISIALAEYQRSQYFVASPWQRFVNGDDSAISATAKAGAVIFFKDYAEGGAGCANCHSGDFFSDEDFHVLAMPQLGKGKNNGPNGNDDFGRSRVTFEPDDRYKFRTPSLLNVSLTAPYGHSGSYQNLVDVIRHHLDPEAAIDAFDFSLAGMQLGLQGVNAEDNTRAALNQWQQHAAAGKSMLNKVSLSNTQIESLTEFLQTLTDDCASDNECLTKWIPTGNDPDGLRLVPNNL